MRSIREIQQEFAEMLGLRAQIIWDLLSSKQEDLLKAKIKALIPDQKKGQKNIERIRKILFKNIWAQKKYTNGNLLFSIIYVFVTNKKGINEAPEARNWSCHPVFRIRKCVDLNNNSENCCMVFIDETGRTYKNWKSYVEENELPKGIMVAPRNGVYTMDDDGCVKLQCYGTPASRLVSKALAVTDTTSSVLGALSTIAPLAAIFTVPVAPVLLTGSAIVGGGIGGYSILRSVMNLVDRGKHDQSIALTDRQALNSWLGVTAGVVGFAAAGATKTMKGITGLGYKIPMMTRLVVDGINISSIVLSGAGTANGVLDIILSIHNKEDIRAMDVLQLAASLVLFTHSVANFELAKTIINNSQNQKIQSYRKDLSNSQRRMLDKLSRETIRIRGETNGKVDIIRNINEIPSKQYLNDLYKVNKNLNERNILPAFGKGGSGIVLNNDVPVDTATLRASVQHNQGPDILGQVQNSIPDSYQRNQDVKPRHSLFASKCRNPKTSFIRQWAKDVFEGSEYVAEAVDALCDESVFSSSVDEDVLPNFDNTILGRISDADSFENLINVLNNKFCRRSFRFLVNLIKRFVEEKLEGIERHLEVFISLESVLYHAMEYCRRNSLSTFEKLVAKEEEIFNYLENYFKSLSVYSHGDLLKKCPDCNGYFHDAKF